MKKKEFDKVFNEVLDHLDNIDSLTSIDLICDEEYATLSINDKKFKLDLLFYSNKSQDTLLKKFKEKLIINSKN